MMNRLKIYIKLAKYFILENAEAIAGITLIFLGLAWFF